MSKNVVLLIKIALALEEVINDHKWISLPLLQSEVLSNSFSCERFARGLTLKPRQKETVFLYCLLTG